jgi:hypothetical protein
MRIKEISGRELLDWHLSMIPIYQLDDLETMKWR